MPCPITGGQKGWFVMWKKGMLAACCALILAGMSQASITVTGTGKVKYAPDVAHLGFGVSGEGKTAAEAWKKNADAVKKVFAALRALGIADKDLQTGGVNVSPRYVHEKDKEPRLVGYVATYDLSVTVRRLADVGAVLDAAVEAGVNQRASISFACNDPEKLIQQARLAAATEARAKARVLAEGAGAGLGLVKTISEGSHSPWRTQHLEMPARGDMAANPLPIAAGEQEITVSVTVTYDLTHGTR
jgi:uncharacterized protein YggE